jgi:hypothetical protein
MEFRIRTCHCICFLDDLYSSPNIIRVIKSRRMRWVGHVARMEESEVRTGCCWGNVRKGNHLGDPGVGGRIILKWISKQWDEGHGLDWASSGYGQMAGSCECGNEPPGSIKCGGGGNFLTSWETVSFSRRSLLHGVLYLFLFHNSKFFMIDSKSIKIWTVSFLTVIHIGTVSWGSKTSKSNKRVWSRPSFLQYEVKLFAHQFSIPSCLYFWNGL